MNCLTNSSPHVPLEPRYPPTDTVPDLLTMDTFSARPTNPPEQDVREAFHHFLERPVYFAPVVHAKRKRA